MDFIPPQMPAEVEQYLSLYDDLFSRPEMREHFRYYIAGLISETNHKNLFQIMSKVIEGNYQSGHHFFSHSPWPSEKINLRRLDLWQRDPLTRISPSGWWIQDDTGQVRRLRGKANPENENRLTGGTDGVARQYIGNVGKISEGLVFVSTHYADLGKRLPLVADLYWPEAARLRLPEQELTPERLRSKITIALDQLRYLKDDNNIRGPKPRQVVADSW